MPVELLLIGLAGIVAALLLVPAIRRLAWTFVDVVDASVAMFTIRRAMGLDTRTARDRRIERRRAREQAEIERRIGAADAGASPLAAAPTKLVVSGTGAAPTAVTVAAVTPPPPAPRGARQNLRDGALAAVAVVVVGLVLAVALDLPEGAVLGATSEPPGGVVRATDDPDATDAGGVAVPTATPTPAPTATPAPTPTPPPVATDLGARLVGKTAARGTVNVELSWAAGEAAAGSGLALEARVDDGDFTRIEQLADDATKIVRPLETGRTYEFRLVATDGRDGAGTPAAWAPITPARTQESSPRVAYDGAWRSASGPSLLGETVRFARAKGATARFTFTGTDVGWVATRTPLSGRAQVRIDGKRVATIDLRADAVQYRRLVFRQHLETSGPHDLEIRVLGDGRVDLDAFVVLR